MNDIIAGAQAAARANNNIDARLEEIFIKHFGLESVEGEEPKEAGYMAYGMMAVDVAMRIANVFLAIKNPTEHRTYRAICDLTYELGVNEFWRKNANVINPIMHVCTNTYRDGVELLLRRAQRDEYSSYDALISASRAAPLEIFPVIAYLLGGPKLMVSSSLALKLELAPYFIS